MKSLGPNDQLINAIRELDALLENDKSATLSQINFRTYRALQLQTENFLTGMRVEDRTTEIQHQMTSLGIDLHQIKEIELSSNFAILERLNNMISSYLK